MHLKQKSKRCLWLFVPFFATVIGFPVFASAQDCGWCNADISGTVYHNKYYYGTVRTIYNPPSSGPDIAAIKFAGPASMRLGAHSCHGTDLAPSKLLPTSTYVGIVGHGTTFSTQTFCLFTEPGGGGSTGTFTANLDWD